ncbi:Alpha/beta hydrolase family [Carpediemonas membranifera]|uniref:Alpha/beta hydrolase family n=1 Tax=Carpediemonas membranifera TaxID=201153 RepID=A0A8J6E4S1_9EUKA|nr:Alpha/beta hydrolase family [Carpediemonas membranifera]|eukprot:KAG9394867.1 Alpha/beta hydrolase family [Carpediemonas membranifera]
MESLIANGAKHFFASGKHLKSPLEMKTPFRLLPVKKARAHLETIVPVIFHNKRVGKNPNLTRFHRFPFQLSDGEYNSLCYFRTPLTDADPLPVDAPVVLLIHGLSGDSTSQYMIASMHMAHRHGWRAIGVDGRGVSTPQTRAKSFSAMCDADLKEVVEHVVEKFPGAPIAVCGWSLGGVIVLRYLRDPHPAVKVGVATSTPLELEKTVDALDNGLSKMYRGGMLDAARGPLLDAVEHGENIGLEECGVTPDIIRKCVGAREFVEEVIAPTFGYPRSRAHEYYRELNARHWKDELVHVPLLIMQAANDPLLSKSDHQLLGSFPVNVQTILFPSGGHLGFWSGWPPKNISIQLLSMFLEANLERSGVVEEEKMADDMADDTELDDEAALVAKSRI